MRIFSDQPAVGFLGSTPRDAKWLGTYKVGFASGKWRGIGFGSSKERRKLDPVKAGFTLVVQTRFVAVFQGTVQTKKTCTLVFFDSLGPVNHR